VKAIAAGDDHSAALTQDGKVLIVGDGGNTSQLGTSIEELAAGSRFTVVRKKNGTAAGTGVNFDGRCDVFGWTDLEKITAGRHHTVGLKKDGTLVATGDNKQGQCDVHKLERK
jgi:alpha-tubulin suppressor-like RCC1 family protein